MRPRLMLVATLGLIGCGPGAPTGPLEREQHAVEREGSPVTIDLTVQHAIGDLKIQAE